MYTYNTMMKACRLKSVDGSGLEEPLGFLGSCKAKWSGLKTYRAKPQNSCWADPIPLMG